MFGGFDSACNTTATDPTLAFKNNIAANFFADVANNWNALSAMATPDSPKNRFLHLLWHRLPQELCF